MPLMEKRARAITDDSVCSVSPFLDGSRTASSVEPGSASSSDEALCLATGPRIFLGRNSFTMVAMT